MPQQKRETMGIQTLAMRVRDRSLEAPRLERGICDSSRPQARLRTG